jgi:hypothetical protein
MSVVKDGLYRPKEQAGHAGRSGPTVSKRTIESPPTDHSRANHFRLHNRPTQVRPEIHASDPPVPGKKDFAYFRTPSVKVQGKCHAEESTISNPCLHRPPIDRPDHEQQFAEVRSASTRPSSR